MKIRPVGAELLHTESWTDVQTERHDEDISEFFSNFANAPKNE